MKGFRVWSDYWKKYAAEAELYMDGSVDAVFEDDDGVPHHENTDLVVEFKTGVKDKNGKEIYEGDIVKEVIDTGLDQFDGTYIYTVQWSDYFYAFVIQANHITSSGQFFHDELYQLNMSREVIGNIHENPGLLKGGRMRAYRIVLQCQSCKKVYTDYWALIYGVKPHGLCPKCGTIGKVEEAVARPRPFRIGWEVKEEE